MGIDVYLQWKKQSKEEADKQLTGFSVVSGDVGYLREAYHGEPYATKVLVGDAFGEDKKIPASVLRERLPETIKTVITRALHVYKEKLAESSPVVKAFVDFVELAEKKEKETGEACTVHVSA